MDKAHGTLLVCRSNIPMSAFKILTVFILFFINFPYKNLVLQIIRPFKGLKIVAFVGQAYWLGEQVQLFLANFTYKHWTNFLVQ